MTCDLVVTAAADILLVRAWYDYKHPLLDSKNTAFYVCRDCNVTFLAYDEFV